FGNWPEKTGLPGKRAVRVPKPATPAKFFNLAAAEPSSPRWASRRFPDDPARLAHEGAGEQPVVPKPRAAGPFHEGRGKRSFHRLTGALQRGVRRGCVPEAVGSHGHDRLVRAAVGLGGAGSRQGGLGELQGTGEIASAVSPQAEGQKRPWGTLRLWEGGVPVRHRAGERFEGLLNLRIDRFK